jgi:hypothetical protein
MGVSIVMRVPQARWMVYFMAYNALEKMEEKSPGN